MKKLSLLMFAILILGCGTETTLVEEPEPVAEEPEPVVMEDEPVGHPLVAEGTVRHGEVNVDPARLNSTGFRLVFTKPFYRYWIWLNDKDGNYLPGWDSLEAGGWGRTDVLFILPLGFHSPLEYDTEYKILISAQNFDCDYTDIVIQFRTKPQRPGVGQPKLVIQEHIPVAASGERFRRDPAEPQLVAGDVAFGEQNVDPEPLNANGIHFEFDEPIRKYKIDLRLKGGATLGWLPRDLVDNQNMGKRIQIMPAEGFPLLEFNTAYEIEIFVQDAFCWTSDFKIRFRTMPKP